MLHLYEFFKLNSSSMIECDRPLVYGWHTNRFTCASLGLYIEAVVPSAGDGEPGDKNRAIKR